MARFRRRDAASKLTPISTNQSKVSRPPTLHLPADREKQLFSNLFALWPNHPSPEIADIDESPKQCPSEFSPSSASSVPGFGWQFEQSFNQRSTYRLPRHVPILIPDHAQPFAIETALVSKAPASPVRSFRDPQVATSRSILKAHCHRSNQLRGHRIVNFPAKKEALESNMNNSQVSLSASESGMESGSGSGPTQQGGNIGFTGGNTQNVAAGNLSGLVCNVHRTTGQEPAPRVGATTTILGDRLYVFGGRVHSHTKPYLTSDLYELDLTRRHWKKVDAAGDIPPPRYFHSVCALGDSKLVCYGGMSPHPHLRSQTNTQGSARSGVDPQPEVVVMSDIHVYDIYSKKWKIILSAGVDSPQGRYAHCATILPSSAVFTSADAPMAAIQHNPPSNDPHSGTLGVQLDGTGGAEMVVVGGQDSANNYIEQISVFNMRSLKWTSVVPYDHKCGAYKSMIAALPGINVQGVGQESIPLESTTNQPAGTSMLIYSNYNFLDVKLELQLRLHDGSLIERPMAGKVSPPGLRFPNGGVINGHFVVSGTYLTSTKHEYALWALDLRTLTWGRIDTAGTVFAQGSWNRGVVWNRRNVFIILGHRKRSLVDDYNHRRINFKHVCMVELEAFGLYNNPRKTSPNSAYVSVSAPSLPASLQSSLPSRNVGGRSISAIAEKLGQTALNIVELSDMEIVATGGERIPCNSNILARRWGSYFHQLMLNATTNIDTTASDAATLRPSMNSQASRISAITITPGMNGIAPHTSDSAAESQRSASQATTRTLVELPNGGNIPAQARQRSLYLPHMASTIRLMLYFLYTSSLPPLSHSLCNAHTLCSLLQMARPYQIDGLLEATIERLHEGLDGRFAAAVFNAAALAAGGGRAAGGDIGGTLAELERRESQATAREDDSTLNARSTGIQNRRGHGKTNSTGSASTATSATSSADYSHTESEGYSQDDITHQHDAREVWTGDMSAVIGLQKRGLRGLVEGRRLRERANTGE